MGRLLLLFIALPLLELYLLLRIGARVGFVPTLAGVLVVGAVGAFLAKREGLRVLRKWQESLSAGRVPEEGVLGGVLVLVGGVLLITPGVITDFVGLLLLFPPTRALVAGVVRQRLERGIADGTVHVVTMGSHVTHGPVGRPARPGGVIDVEGEELPPEHERLPR